MVRLTTLFEQHVKDDDARHRETISRIDALAPQVQDMVGQTNQNRALAAAEAERLLKRRNALVETIKVAAPFITFLAGLVAAWFGLRP